MPKIETRPEQTAVGKRAIMPMSDFDTQVPRLTAEVMEWIDHHEVRPTGKPFLRYHVIDMPQRMDVELGVPVQAVPRADADLHQGTLPAGRYAVSTFKGISNGIAANKELIDWIAAQGEAMVVQGSEHGQVFECRCETVLTDAKAEPDRDQWVTEIAIKLRD